jgi:hypothetical protein
VVVRREPLKVSICLCSVEADLLTDTKYYTSNPNSVIPRVTVKENNTGVQVHHQTTAIVGSQLPGPKGRLARSSAADESPDMPAPRGT